MMNGASTFHTSQKLFRAINNSIVSEHFGQHTKVPVGLGVFLGPSEGWQRGTDTLCPLVWDDTPVHWPCAGPCPAPPLCRSLPQRCAVESLSERYLQNEKDSTEDEIKGVSAWVKSAVPSGINWKRYKHLHRYIYIKSLNWIKGQTFIGAVIVSVHSTYLVISNKSNKPLFPSHWRG